MERGSPEDETPTRREYVRYAGAVAGGGLLAGCTGGSGSESTPNATETEADDATGTEAGDPTETAPDASHSVAMEPVGTVEFDGVPETWVPYTGDYADMGVALGRADGLAAIGVRARFGSHLYEELPGVAVEKDDLTQLWQDGTGKEVYYELDADVHVTDPNFVENRLGWSRADVEEVGANVGPFFGNTVFSRAYDWHDYRYYTLYEAFEKVAEMFQERERYEAFSDLHDEVLDDVESRLPSETPDIAVLYPADVPPESFYPYLVDEGTQSKHWNDLNVGDALARNGVTDAQAGGGTIDYETLLEIDPDAVAIRLQGEITPEYFEENIVSHLRDHDVASELTAVQNGRVVYGGLTYQGPILHLFQLERAAQGLYPEEFGDERLFDRERVAGIVNGEF
ncbi:iron complex transport system substrate-binding protein [Halopelagius inordinatus]|uniref:Iron complex transport system substrate-binding protein n=1 Tax=Halopelagius inordinatus TaxID=553467 RepID=A0A1I2P630_9EURY|nr:ABC transporter substrate-binding protein [Halopelagius inordinatus]SFG08941.1 iron complex transport system substrate-binding protein [Halopelagius inordinatus]